MYQYKAYEIAIPEYISMTAPINPYPTFGSVSERDRYVIRLSMKRGWQI
jgi:hypothetical protein